MLTTAKTTRNSQERVRMLSAMACLLKCIVLGTNHPDHVRIAEKHLRFTMRQAFSVICCQKAARTMSPVISSQTMGPWQACLGVFWRFHMNVLEVALATLPVPRPTETHRDPPRPTEGGPTETHRDPPRVIQPLPDSVRALPAKRVAKPRCPSYFGLSVWESAPIARQQQSKVLFGLSVGESVPRAIGNNNPKSFFVSVESQKASAELFRRAGVLYHPPPKIYAVSHELFWEYFQDMQLQFSALRQSFPLCSCTGPLAFFSICICSLQKCWN